MCYEPVAERRRGDGPIDCRTPTVDLKVKITEEHTAFRSCIQYSDAQSTYKFDRSRRMVDQPGPMLSVETPN